MIMAFIDSDIIKASVTTNTAVMVTLVVGALCAIYPRNKLSNQDLTLLPTEFMAQLSDVLNRLLYPCLISYTISSSLTMGLLQEAWPLIIYSWILSILSSLIAYATLGLFKVPKFFRDEWCAMIGPGNAVTLPLVMIEILSNMPPINIDRDSADVLTTGTSLVFMYGIGWTLAFWSVAIILWFDPKQGSGDSGSGSGGCWDSPRMRKIRKSVSKLCANPINHSTAIGTFVGLVVPLKELLIKPKGYLSCVGAALRTMGAPSVGIQTIILGGVLGKSIAKFYMGGSVGAGDEKGIGRVPMIGAEGIAIQAILQEETETTTVNRGDAGRSGTGLTVDDVELGERTESESKSKGAIDDAASDASDDLSADSHMDIMREQRPRARSRALSDAYEIHRPDDEPITPALGLSHIDDSSSLGIPMITFGGLVFVKMILLPILLMPFVYFSSPYLLDENSVNYSLSMLILYLQTFLPSSNTVLCVYQQLKMFRSTEILAQVYLVQYLVSFVSVVVFLSIALTLAY